MPDPLLLVIRELGAERSVSVSASTRLGRGSQADLILADSGVSRIHAQFSPGPSGWVVEDAGSRNGTLLNGDRLAAGQQVPVHPGDNVQLGGATVVVAASARESTVPLGLTPPPLASVPGSAAQSTLPSSFSWTPPGGTALAAPPASSPTATWSYDASTMRLAAAAAGAAQSATATGDFAPVGHAAAPSGAPAPAQAPPMAQPQAPGAPVPAPPPVPGTAAVIPGIVRVGRAIDNDIAIADPRVASYHLDARWGPEGLTVRDLSGGQTTVEHQALTGAPIYPEATLYLGGTFALPARALIERLAVVPAVAGAPSHRAVPELEHLLVARGVKRQVGEKLILRGVDFSVRRGQFVAVAGASGAGKSTLMNVLNGYTAPDEGSVDVVRDADGEPDLGYVPQDDIIHRTLTLKDAVVLSAMLRFPPGTLRGQVEARCEEVLTELGLREHANTRVERLSGGQRKRASVALELMTRPRLLLLDEPTSGLDPASDRRLIALLGALADSGYGVVLITHTTTNIDACDTVAFLAPGGHLIFWGSPQEARTYFGVTNLVEVYDRLEDPNYGTPEEWRTRFEASPYYAKLREEVDAGAAEFEQQRRATPPMALGGYPGGPGMQGPGMMGGQFAGGPPPGFPPQYGGGVPPGFPPQYGSAAASTPPPRKPGLTSWQIKGLSNRYLRTLLADRRTLIIMLVQAPFIVILARLLFPGDALSANVQDVSNPAFTSGTDPNPIGTILDHAGKGVQLLFLLGTTLVWLGTINAAREICKETPIWQRERHAGVRPGPYLLSKFVVLGGMCLAQVALWLILILILFGLPDSGGPPGFFVIGLATAISGVAVGLVISAASPTPDRAVTFVPLVMIPQLLFSGAIISLSEMGGFGSGASALFSGRWTFEGLGRLIDPNDRFLDPNTGGPSDTITSRGFDGSSGTALLALLLLTVAFGALAAWLISTKGMPKKPRAAQMRPVAAPAMAGVPYGMPPAPGPYPQHYAPAPVQYPPPPPPGYAPQPPPPPYGPVPYGPPGPGQPPAPPYR